MCRVLVGMLLVAAAAGLPLCDASAAATSASFRVVGGSFAGGTEGALQSTDPEPAVGGAGATLAGPVAPGLVTSAGGVGVFGGFWPIVGGMAAGCGDGVLEVPEECDDGGPQDGDGCSATCELEDETAFQGTAEGGYTISVDVDGVTVSIVTTAGWSGADVALALAAAIAADPTLQALGTTAVAIGNTVVTNGTLANLVIDDPGISSAPPTLLPALGRVGLLLLAAGLVAAARRAARARATRSANTMEDFL